VITLKYDEQVDSGTRKLTALAHVVVTPLLQRRGMSVIRRDPSCILTSLPVKWFDTGKYRLNMVEWMHLSLSGVSSVSMVQLTVTTSPTWVA